MNVQSQFTPEEIQALISGETVSKSVKASSSANKTSKKVEPVEGGEVKSYTPRFSVPINEKQDVSRPNIYDNAGNRVSPDSVVGISPGKLDAIDKDLYAEKARVQAEHDAAQELRKIASPEQLLNQLNGLRRIVEKQSKEIAALKKQVKE